MKIQKYNQEQEECLRSLFKALQEETLPESFVNDTMTVIRRETAKSKVIMWVLIIAGSASALAAATVACFRFLPGSVVARYVNTVFATVKQSFSIEIFPQPLSNFGLMFGAAVMILLFADLIFEVIIMKRLTK